MIENLNQRIQLNIKTYSFKKYLFGAALFAVVIIGVGCGNNTTRQTGQAPEQESAKAESVAQPPGIQPLPKAYEFCEKQGNNVAMRYDNQSQRPIISCVFANNTECEIVDYFYNNCGPDKNNKLAMTQTDSELTDLRYCDRTSPVVCGRDGNNYTNYCVAAQLNIEILHEGLCTDSEQAEPLVPGKSPVSTQDTQTANADLTETQKEAGVAPQVEINTGEYAVWLSTLFDIVEAGQPKNPRTSVEKCRLGTDGIYYYYKESCEDCFSVLYTNDGNISCFPNNNMTDACPAFNRTGRSAYCKQIWRDKR